MRGQKTSLSIRLHSAQNSSRTLIKAKTSILYLKHSAAEILQLYLTDKDTPSPSPLLISTSIFAGFPENLELNDPFAN